jgi:hypothetical protein
LRSRSLAAGLGPQQRLRREQRDMVAGTAVHVGRSPPRRRTGPSAPAALLALIMYLLKPVLQACSILAMRIGQTIAKLVFSVPKPLAMLPLLSPVVLVSPRLRRRNTRDLRNWNLNVRLPRRWTLGISRPFREGAGEQDRHTCSKAEFRHSYSPVSTIADPRGDFPKHVRWLCDVPHRPCSRSAYSVDRSSRSVCYCCPASKPRTDHGGSHMTRRWRKMDSNFRFRASSDYAGVGRLALHGTVRARPSPDIRIPRCTGLPAGGRWIRTFGENPT